MLNELLDAVTSPSVGQFFYVAVGQTLGNYVLSHFISLYGIGEDIGKHETVFRAAWRVRKNISATEPTLSISFGNITRTDDCDVNIHCE